MKTFWRVFLGLLVIGIIVSLVTLFHGNRPVGSENLVGHALPDFAAPLASGTQNADSNIYTPAQAKAVHSTAACDVDLPGVFNSCRDLKGHAVLVFWNSTKSECVGQVDTLDAFSKANPDVSVAALAFDQSEGKVRSVASERGWKLPVPIDRDGAVAGLYAVAGCPTVYFSDRGTITGVKLGVLTQQQLEQGLEKRAGATGVTD
ncbi:MAG: hypothetical protein QM648_02760 [Solirubrobacterales bacterium]